MLYTIREIDFWDSQVACLPMGFKSKMSSNLTTLILSSFASPHIGPQHSFEYCLYDDSLIDPLESYSSDTIVTCSCSGWSFEVSVGNPNLINILTEWNGDINTVDFVPNTIQVLEITLADIGSMVMIPWLQYTNIKVLTIQVLLENGPSPSGHPGLSTGALPSSIISLYLLGAFSSLPSNLWELPNLINLQIQIIPAFQIPTTIPVWNGTSTATKLSIFDFGGINISNGLEIPDFSVYSPNIKLIGIEASSNFLPVLSQNLSSSSQITLVLHNMSHINQFDWIYKLNNSLNIEISLPDATSLCGPNIVCPLPSTLSTLYLDLPNIYQLNISFPDGSSIRSLQIHAPLTDHPFASLPSTSTSLSNLTTLELSDNLLGSGNQSTSDLICLLSPGLTTLTISNSTITRFPSFANCSFMSQVFIINCPNLDFNTLPDMSTVLPALQQITLQSNHFVSVPSNLCYTNATVIDLSFNLIASLPNCSYSVVTSKSVFWNLASNSLSDWNQVLHLANWTYPVVSLYLNSNNLGISKAPPNLAAYFPQLTVLHLQNNSISAQLSDQPWISLLQRLTQFLISSNQFYGPIDPTLFPPITSRIYDLSYNLFNGSLSLQLICGEFSFSSLLVASNRLDSWNDLFDPSIPCSLSTLIQLDISHNLFSSLPDSNFSQIPNLAIFRMDGNTGFNGQPLPSFIASLTTQLNRDFSLSSCGFQDTLNPLIFPSISKIDLSNNNLHGFIPSTIWNSMLYLNLSSNKLNGTIPDPDFNPIMINLINNHYSSNEVDLSSNQLTGSLPSNFTWLGLYTMRLSNLPSLTGPVPFISPPTLMLDFPINIDLSFSSGLSFCSVTDYQNFIHRAGSCNVAGTQVCSCPQLYPQCDTSFCPPSISCTGSPPSPSFVCINGAWTSTGSLTSPNPITISGPVTIGGNLVSSSPVTIIIPFSSSSSSPSTQPGYGSSIPLISIYGCFQSSSSSIIIPLTQSDVNYLSSQKGGTSVSLISQSGANCSTDISSLNIQVQQPKSCKKVTAKVASNSDNDHLVVLFTVNTNSCNTWWIIVVSVLGGLLILSVIIFMIIYANSPTLKSKIQPFWVRTKAGSEASQVPK